MHIKLHNIHFSYGEKEVFSALNLVFPENALTCLLGETGSGKTSLLRIISGLEVPNVGKVELNGQTVTEGKKSIVPPADRNIGYVFQDLALWPHMRVLENVTWGLRQKKHSDPETVAKGILDQLGIGEEQQKYPHQLSGGQQQLLAIARAIAPQPDILLMDEPLLSLDKRLKAHLIQQIKMIRQQFKTSIIYVTHDGEEAFQLADHIVIIGEKGKVVDKGTPDQIRLSEHPVAKALIKG